MNCAQCAYGAQCMCMKLPQNEVIPNTVRDCWENPHGALSTGCFENYYMGQLVRMCYCDTSLCNSAGKIGVNLVITVTLAFVRHIILN